MSQTITPALGVPHVAARPSRRIEPTKIQTIYPVHLTMPTVKMRVAAYARVSSEQESQEGSYELQCEHYTDFITSHEDWSLVKVYADEGKTGTSTSRRTEFRQMIADCEAGLIDCIITKSISRFARNTVDCLETVRKLKNLPRPVGVYFEKENIDTLDGKSELLLTILSSLAQDESRSISENIRWSLQKLYESGYVHCPTTNLLGYDTVFDYETKTNKMVIEPVGAAVVQMIYDHFLHGAGYSEIAHGMEQLGARTGAGCAHWTAIAVRRILTNEKYVGDAITQKGFTRDFLTHARMANNGQMPQYIAEGHHEAIIERADWLVVQDLIRSGAGTERGSKVNQATGCAPHRSVKTVFSSKLFCGSCHAPLIRRSASSSAVRNGTNRYFIWKCRNAEGRGDRECNTRSIPEMVLEQTFMEMLHRMAARPRAELQADFMMANGIEITPPVDETQAENLRLELESVRSHIDSMIADPNLYADMLEEQNARVAEIQAQMNSAPDWSAVHPLKKATFDWFLDQLYAMPAFDITKAALPFRADIFSRCVERGEVREVKDAHGKLTDIAIRYTYTFGLEATAYGNRRSITVARKMEIEKAIGA